MTGPDRCRIHHWGLFSSSLGLKSGVHKKPKGIFPFGKTPFGELVIFISENQKVIWGPSFSFYFSLVGAGLIISIFDQIKIKLIPKASGSYA